MQIGKLYRMRDDKLRGVSKYCSDDPVLVMNTGTENVRIPVQTTLMVLKIARNENYKSDYRLIKALAGTGDVGWIDVNQLHWVRE